MTEDDELSQDAKPQVLTTIPRQRIFENEDENELFYRIFNTFGIKPKDRREIDTSALKDNITGLAKHPKLGTTGQKNAWIMRVICDFNRPTKPKLGERLLEHYTKKFSGWKKDDFEGCNKTFLRALKDYFQSAGVTIPGNANIKTSKRLVKAMAEVIED